MLQDVKNVLISLSDKTDLTPVLKILKKINANIISSGGTYKTIKSLGYTCKEVSTYTVLKRC